MSDSAVTFDVRPESPPGVNTPDLSPWVDLLAPLMRMPGVWFRIASSDHPREVARTVQKLRYVTRPFLRHEIRREDLGLPGGRWDFTVRKGVIYGRYQVEAAS